MLRYSLIYNDNTAPSRWVLLYPEHYISEDNIATLQFRIDTSLYAYSGLEATCWSTRTRCLIPWHLCCMSSLVTALSCSSLMWLISVPNDFSISFSSAMRETPVKGRCIPLTRFPAGVLMTLAVRVVPDQLPAAVVRQGELVITDPVPFLQYETVNAL